jgi:hypothetical protein
MLYVTIRSHQVSLVLILILEVCIVGPIAFALTYTWETEVTKSVATGPLSITSFPSVINTNPGENETLNISIENTANIDYVVTLYFVLNDTAYQQAYMNFSSTVYTISPGSNNITAWCETSVEAPPARLSFTVGFTRV